MSDEDNELQALQARVAKLEAKAAGESAAKKKSERTRHAASDAEASKQPGIGMLLLDGFLFLVGTGGVFAFVYGEMQWHWAIAALIAPLGGVVVWMLGKAGVTI